MTLWDDDEGWRRVEEALDGAVARFGRGAVTRATLLGKARGGGALPSNFPPLASNESGLCSTCGPIAPLGSATLSRGWRPSDAGP